MITEKSMSAVLTSILAQLRHKGNCPGQLGEQAAGAIESLWRDNTALTRGLLQMEEIVSQTMDLSAAINRFRAIRSVGKSGEQP